MFLFHWTIIILIPGIILAIYSQMKVKRTYKEYAKIRSRKGVEASRVARYLLDSHGLNSVNIEPVKGELTDHYDPKSKTLRLSAPIYNDSSIASVGIAAHEAGHAIQHGQGYAPLALRNFIYPVAGLGSNLAFIIFFIGFVFVQSSLLMDIGIILYSAMVVFTVLTLPIEFDASKRAVALLESGNYLYPDEVEGAKKVLSAAALTYVAATAAAILSLIQMLILRRD